MKFKKYSAPSMAVAMALMGGVPAQAADETMQAAEAMATLHYDIAEQSLESGLTAFAQMSDLQIAYDPDLVDGLSSMGVTGDLTPRQALDKLLVGSGLTARFTAAGTVTLTRINKRQLEAVTVTAGRTEKPLTSVPNTVTVIDEAEIETQLLIHNDLSTLLGNTIPSYSPGRQKLTNAGESLRGRKPLYLIDGIPQSNPLRDSSRDGNTIDPRMIERVEVIHGPNAIHGLGASGGIINLITKRPGETFQQSLSLDTTFQEEELGESASYGLSYSASGAWGQWDGIGSLSYRSNGVGYDANGEVIGFDMTQGDTMDATSLDAFLKLGYNWEQQRLELTFNDYTIEGNHDWVAVNGDVDAGTATTAEKGSPEGDSTSNDVTTLGLLYENDDVFADQSFTAQLYRQDFAATFGGSTAGSFQDPAFGPDLFDQTQNNSEKMGLKLTLVKDDLADLPLSLVYGLDVIRDKTWQSLIQTGRTYVPETTYENYAPFAQFEYAGITDLVLTAGVRHEESELQVDDFQTVASKGSQQVDGGNPGFSETLFNLGFTYAFTDSVRGFANYAESMSMPDVGRVLRGIDEPNQDVETLLKLNPIITDNVEVGVEYRTDLVSAHLSYYTSSSDYGQRFQSDADGIYSVKREKAEIDGYELGVNWFATDNDELGLGYAHTEGQYDSDQDGSVDTDLSGANIAPDRLNVSWDRDWNGDISTRLQANHLLDRKFKDSDGATTAEFNGYTTFDLSTRWQLEDSSSVSLGAHNLTNKDYFTYHSQTTGSDVRNFKGLGRTITLSYEMQF